MAGESDPEDEDDEEMEEEIRTHLLFKIEDGPPPKEDEDMPDAPHDRDKEGTIMAKKVIGLEGGVEKRDYTIGDGLRVHEFRVG